MNAYSGKKDSKARAWIIGSLLIPVNCYWIIQTEQVRGAEGPTTFSFFFNAIFTLLVLFVLNIGLRRFTPKAALNNKELLTIYIVVSMASAMCSDGMLPVLLTGTSYAFWGATPENEWQELFHRYIPRWLAVDDLSVLKGYYRGEDTLYTAKNLKAWVPPLLWWSFLTFVLIFVMLCINVNVRRQWIEKEKLSYPIAEIPLNMVNPNSYSRLAWIGLAIGVVINLINGIHFLHPAFPGLTFVKRQEIGHIFTDRPWNALRAMRISFIPSIIGLSFFMPLDLLFSCWFFYFYWQFMRVLGAMAGWRSYPGYGAFPYIVQESVGAFLAILAVAVWMGRRHFSETLKKVFIKNGDTDDTANAPMSYRTAWIGIICGAGILVLFCYRTGMSVRIAVLFILFYYAISTAVTRLRAEVGFPIHDVHFGGPVQMVTSSIGSANLSRSTLGAVPLFWFISRHFIGHAMPHQLEGFRMSERIKMANRRTMWSILLGSAVGIVATFWLLLHVSYKVGIDNMHPGLIRQAPEPWRYLRQWLLNPTGVDYHHIGLVGLGFASALFMSFMRVRFLWWPLHPIGYAVAGSYGMSFLWSCMLVSWSIKRVLLRYGGIKRYRQAVPLFLGLVLGELSIAAMWTIIGVALKMPRIYQFWVG